MVKKKPQLLELNESFLPNQKFALTDERRTKIRDAIGAFLGLEPHEQSVYLRTLSGLPGNRLHEEVQLTLDLFQQVHDLKKMLAKHRRPRKQSERNATIARLREDGLTQGQIGKKLNMERRTVQKVLLDTKKRALRSLEDTDWEGIAQSIRNFLELASHTEGDFWHIRKK